MRGLISDIDTIANPISNGAGAVGDMVEIRSHFVEFVRVEINKKWYLLSDADMGAWRFHIIAEKKDEAADNQDYNGDGDKDDEVWVDAGSVSDATNSGF